MSERMLIGVARAIIDNPPREFVQGDMLCRDYEPTARAASEAAIKHIGSSQTAYIAFANEAALWEETSIECFSTSLHAALDAVINEQVKE